MPAGTDLVTWNPRVGSSGDDRYDPGDARISVGDSSGYSTPPTLAEVNAGSGINQLIAESNRRLLSGDSYVGFPVGVPSYMSYLSPGGRIEPLYWWNVLRPGLNVVLDVEEFTTIPLDFDPNAKVFIGSKNRFFDYRKAMSIDHFRYSLNYNKLGPSGGSAIEKTDLTYHPEDQPFHITLFPLTSQSVGQHRIGLTSPYQVARSFIPFDVPSLSETINSVKLDVNFHQFYTGVSWSISCYSSSSDFSPIDVGDWGERDNFMDSKPAASNGFNKHLVFDISGLVKGSRTVFSIISNKDLAKTPPTFSGLETANLVPERVGGKTFLKLYT